MKFTAVLSATILFAFAAASPLAQSTPVAEPMCSCDEQICVASWPESCYCANKDKMDCYNKCGGTKPSMQNCSAANPDA